MPSVSMWMHSYLSIISLACNCGAKTLADEQYGSDRKSQAYWDAEKDVSGRMPIFVMKNFIHVYARYKTKGYQN